MPSTDMYPVATGRSVLWSLGPNDLCERLVLIGEQFVQSIGGDNPDEHITFTDGQPPDTVFIRQIRRLIEAGILLRCTEIDGHYIFGGLLGWIRFCPEDANGQSTICDDPDRGVRVRTHGTPDVLLHGRCEVGN